MSALDKNFYYLLTNTPLTYPVCLNEEEAITYLKYINSDDFTYNNIGNYDVIDYEKIFYIEIIYGENEIIQSLLNDIKKNIAAGYVFKNQYKNRIFDFINQEEETVTGRIHNKYYGLPKKIE